jgi:type VI secretion system protein ImpB
VQSSYEDPYDSEKLVELPFVMGIMSDLSGNASTVEKPELDDREFRDVTGATFDTFMADVAPGAAFMVQNKLEPDSNTKLGVELHFSSMEDFNPARIAMQVEPLRKLLEARMQLANLQRYMAGKPKAMEQIEKLLADPELMAALSARGAETEKDA